MNARVVHFVSALLASALLSACSQSAVVTREGAPLARQMTESDQCGVGSEGLTYVESVEGLARLEAWPAQNLSMSVLRRLDFEREHLLLVGLGQKPTGGYALTLASSRIEAGTLHLTVYLRRPPADAVVSQVITTPCAILAIAPKGWKRLEVNGNGLETQRLNRR